MHMRKKSPPPPDSGARGVLDIRKYPNRRYYDATRSRHLTLEEIHDAIREGFEVRVTDNKTGQDITGKVLAQIIIELDPLKLGVFPVAMLHRLLQANQQMVGDFISRYFSGPLMQFLDPRHGIEHYMRQAFSGEGGGGWARMMMNPLAAPWAHGAGSPGGADAQQPLREQVAELTRRLAELSSRVGQDRRAAAGPARRVRGKAARRR